jgi:anti-anti-sigma factor
MPGADGSPFIVEYLGDRRFSLAGELDMASTAAVDEAMAKADGPGDVVFDMSELTFIDSSGVLALSKAAERVEDGSLILRQPTPAVRRVLDLVGLTQAALGIAVED